MYFFSENGSNFQNYSKVKICDWKYSSRYSFSCGKNLALLFSLDWTDNKNGSVSKTDKNRTLCIGIWLLAARAKSLLLVWAVKRDDRHKLGIFMSLKKVCQSDWIRYKIVLLLSIVCGIRYGYLYRIVRGFIVGTTTQTFNFFSAFTRPTTPTHE